MARLLMVLVCLLTVGALLPAAPIPTHLMPKDPPFAFPTQVGTKWVYERNGVEETIVITEVKEEKDGSKLVTTEYAGADGTRTPHQVALISTAGVFVVAAGGVKFAEPRCELKLPHRPGETWTYELNKGGYLIVWTLTAGPVERVKVPAGEFSAVRVEREWIVKLKVPTHWYAHGVGLVRVDEDMKLKSFTPGKD